MPNHFEIAIVALIAVNLLATIYYNYSKQEDYANNATGKIHKSKTGVHKKK